MLSVIKRLQANLKRSKSEKLSKGFPRYREILQAIVDGNEDSIDADELNQALEEAGKDFEQLEADTKLLEKRLAWHREMLDGQQAASQLPKATERLRLLQAELQGHQERLKPLIAEAARAERELHTASTSGAVALSELESIRNCIDVGLVDRLRTLDHRIKEIVSDQRQFAEQVQGGFDQHLPVNVLEHARAKLEKWQALSAQHYHRSEYHSNQVSYWSKVVSTAEQRIDSLKGVVADLDHQIHSLRAERERLQAEMRTP